MSDINVVVSNDSVRLAGGSLHGQTVDVDFVEGVVHVFDGERYVCKTIQGERVLVYVSEVVYNYFLTTASFFTL